MESNLQFINEIDMDKSTHELIKDLRNASFPDHTSDNSYYKQLPHIRCLQYNEDEQLVGYMGLDYRVVGVGDEHYKILGIIDFCVSENFRGNGVGTLMLEKLTTFAESKDVDFIILMSDKKYLYEKNGFCSQCVPSSWLRLHEYKNYGVAFEYLDDLFVKATGSKKWSKGHVDWLGYMF